MAYRFGDVLLAHVPFSDGSGVERPVLVVHDLGDADRVVLERFFAAMLQ